MKRSPISCLATSIIVVMMLVSCSETGYKSVSILQTTDIHGVILPYDYIENKKLETSLASSFTYIRKLKNERDAIILLDNGDNIQGQPAVYYYNFIDTISNHFLSDVMNYMGYDAGTVGNHDIEAGHAVYDRLVREYNFPLMAANAIDINTGKPYFKPYTIIVKDGIKFAVFGLVTPAIPTWLPPELYSGIEFRDMVETAKVWMPVILDEKPDIVIGLFHSGWDRSREELEKAEGMNENGSAAVAYNVPGFDVIFCGHDHRVANEKFVNINGDTILILNGGSRSEKMAQADILISSSKTKGRKHKVVEGKIIDLGEYEPDSEFMDKFGKNHSAIENYVSRVIGNSSAEISSRDSYFGPSAFVDMIHLAQLEITKADISFAAPLSFDVSISEGPVTVSAMFKLYRYENMLYTMKLTGEEIRKYLEYSYAEWFNSMTGPDDLLLNLRRTGDGKPLLTNGKAWFKNQSYNFDSAAGIDYIVDVSKPEGSRITIKGFSDGRSFVYDQFYTVAVNSYRGNGGGGHFTEGAGINKDELRLRLISSTDRDLRYYILKSIEAQKKIEPIILKNWKIIPENWVKKASEREYKLLF